MKPGRILKAYLNKWRREPFASEDVMNSLEYLESILSKTGNIRMLFVLKRLEKDGPQRLWTLQKLARIPYTTALQSIRFLVNEDLVKVSIGKAEEKKTTIRKYELNDKGLSLFRFSKGMDIIRPMNISTFGFERGNSQLNAIVGLFKEWKKV